MVLEHGRFQWTKLPMSTVVAQDILQKKLDTIFLGVIGVTGIADDMIIYRKDEQEHNRNFLNFMDACRRNSLTLNVKKIQFKQSTISFFGYCWSKDGIHPI